MVRRLSGTQGQHTPTRGVGQPERLTICEDEDGGGEGDDDGAGDAELCGEGVGGGCDHGGGDGADEGERGDDGGGSPFPFEAPTAVVEVASVFYSTMEYDTEDVIAGIVTSYGDLAGEARYAWQTRSGSMYCSL